MIAILSSLPDLAGAFVAKRGYQRPSPLAKNLSLEEAPRGLVALLALLPHIAAIIGQF
jgi:hypothetical protein